MDPGYSGALFCMLYNSSDQNVGLMRGHHFATIEFTTTSTSTIGYRSKYQAKSELRDFMPGHAAVGQGGKILEHVEQLKSEWSKWKVSMIGYIGLGATFVATMLAFPKSTPGTEELETRNEMLLSRLDSAEKRISVLLKQLDEARKMSRTPILPERKKNESGK